MNLKDGSVVKNIRKWEGDLDFARLEDINNFVKKEE